jgi:hypothetical protein
MALLYSITPAKQGKTPGQPNYLVEPIGTQVDDQAGGRFDHGWITQPGNPIRQAAILG